MHPDNIPSELQPEKHLSKSLSERFGEVTTNSEEVKQLFTPHTHRARKPSEEPIDYPMVSDTTSTKEEGFAMYPVSSSNIQSIGSHKDIMIVEFTNGTVYKYTPVPQQLVREIETAESVGKKFNESIKSNPEIKFEKVVPKRIVKLMYF